GPAAGRRLDACVGSARAGAGADVVTVCEVRRHRGIPDADVVCILRIPRRNVAHERFLAARLALGGRAGEGGGLVGSDVVGGAPDEHQERDASSRNQGSKIESAGHRQLLSRRERTSTVIRYASVGRSSYTTS